mgnify:FL=1
MIVFGDGNQSRAFSYIGDMAPLISNSIKNKEAYNQVFNVGADIPYSINELISKVAEVFNVSPEIKYLPERNEVVHAHSSHEKIKKYFGDDKTTSLEEGLSIMSNWAKDKGVRATPVFKNIEIRNNLPESWL